MFGNTKLRNCVKKTNTLNIQYRIQLLINERYIAHTTHKNVCHTRRDKLSQKSILTDFKENIRADESILLPEKRKCVCSQFEGLLYIQKNNQTNKQTT